jgi:putative phosphoesterase
MLVGVISDSHDNIYALEKVLRRLVSGGVEAVIHLGDIISPFTVRKMKDILGNIPVYGVLGNNDGDIYLLSKLFRDYNWNLFSGPSIISLGDRRFLIMHGYDGIKHTEKLALKLASLEDVDGVFFGHTHRVFEERVNGKLVFNPGEVCGYLTGKSTYALLDTRDLSVRVYTV